MHRKEARTTGSVRRLAAAARGSRVVAVIAATVLLSAGCTAASGARPDADSAAELQAKFDAAGPGGYVELEPRIYNHSGVLKIRAPGLRVDGNGATLRATNDQTSAVQVEADGVQLTDLRLVAPTEGQRYSGLDQHKLVIEANGVAVSGVSISGSAASGIFVQGARDFRIDNVSVAGTRADGVHITGGSVNGVVTGVRTSQTADDGVAVVSYQSDPLPTSGIRINQVDVASTRWGRGISVVGGQDITIAGFSVANTNAAGLYVATEGAPFFTRSTESVTVSDGNVMNANFNPNIVQGAILLVAENPGTVVRNVAVNGITVSSTPGSAQRDVGIVANGGAIEGISLSDIRITSSAVEPFYSDAPAGSFQVSGLTLDGNPIDVD